MRHIAAAVLAVLFAGTVHAALPLEEEFSADLAEGRGELLEALKSAPLGAGPREPLPTREPTPAELKDYVRQRLDGAGVPDAWLDAVFADTRARVIPGISDRFASTAPAEALPYDRYRRIFLTEARIAAGADFFARNRALLESVRGRYGVDPHLLTALVGVETYYGRQTGTYPVFGALYTISLKVPRRSRWAAGELAELLRLCAPQNQDAHEVLGSYAGAFGLAQFMPSSFVAYGVDFDGDGRRRWDEWPDMLGSAAYYLVRHGYAGSSFDPASPIGRAIFAYNHSENYVRAMLELREAIAARVP